MVHGLELGIPHRAVDLRGGRGVHRRLAPLEQDLHVPIGEGRVDEAQHEPGLVQRLRGLQPHAQLAVGDVHPRVNPELGRHTVAGEVLIDGETALVVIVHDHAVRLVLRDEHGGDAGGHGQGREAEHHPGPEVLVPGTGGGLHGAGYLLSVRRGVRPARKGGRGASSDHRPDEAGALRGREPGIVHRGEGEEDLVAGALEVDRIDLHPHGEIEDLAAGHEVLLLRLIQDQPGQPGHAEHVAVGALVHVDELEGVDVLGEPLVRLAIQRVAVADDVELQRRTIGDGDDERTDQHEQNGCIHEHARAQDPHALALQRVLRGVADQPLGVAHLLHDLIADVHAGRAADALVLQALADVDSGGADLDAERAVDAVAEPLGLGVLPALA